MMVHRKSVQLLFAFANVLLFHIKSAPGIVSGVQGGGIRCLERERQALLHFKEEVEDDLGFLSSWGSEEDKRDCCKWRGVGCSNRTGHVTLLDLARPECDFRAVGGNISNSLLKLQHLNYLDLSCLNFYPLPFPNFGSLNKLRYLNLSAVGFVGTFSYHLGNLSRLQSLDLSSNDDVIVESLDWLSHLSSLENLDLSHNDLRQATDWLQVVNKLPHLEVLRLKDCHLSNSIPLSLSSTNSSKSLSVLDLSANNLTSSTIFHWLSNSSNSLFDVDLSFNYIQGSIPENFGNMTSLKNLDLSVNELQGISRSFGQMCSLRALDLTFNSLNGPLAWFFQNLSGCMENSLEILMVFYNELHGSLPDITRFRSLRELHLSNNQLNGTLPNKFRQRSKLEILILSGNQLTGSLTDVAMLSSLRELRMDGNRLDGNVSESIGRLSELESLILRGNSLQGVISEAHFSNLSKLKELDLFHNSLRLKFGYDWAPPFRLDFIYLRSCNLGPHFPLWLKNQNNCSVLDMSGAGISDTVPDWFWDLSSISDLNLSHNSMRGILPDLSSKYQAISKIDLSYNQFEGPLPPFPSNTQFLDLSYNLFSGPISSLCKIGGTNLTVLDLSDNLLSGELPNCLLPFKGLGTMVLSNNNISGEIPSSIGSITWLSALSLRNNSFSGELPSFLKNCTSLEFLDWSENKLDGEIPSWLGESLLILKFLSLQHNKFYGSIPLQLCQLTDIQILDLSLNNISGIIPKCLNNFTAMIQKSEVNDQAYYDRASIENPFFYANKAWVAWKGREYEYERNLRLLRIIDFAGNKLIGEIPEEIMALLQLVALNLSGNNLTGAIPPKIGQLKQLESLDLSGNQLSSVIPSTMANLNFLSYLNLSYNNLSGKIPSSTQLQSFNSSAFTGNLALCGLPLTQKCPGDETPPSLPPNDNSQGNEEHVDEFWKWFYTAMGIGFSVFFWGVSSALLLKRSWRHTYFQYLDEAWEWIYVKIAVHKASLSKKFQSLS